MPIPATIQTDVKYMSDGKSVFWPIPFPYTSFSDVGVKTINTDDGVETTLTLGKDYQIQGRNVVAVVPIGFQLEIWLTNSLDVVLADLPEPLPHPPMPGGLPVGVPGPGGIPPVPRTPHPVPPLGDPWADRHLGVLSADVHLLKRQLEEGLAIERARECDGQIQRLKETGTAQVEKIETQAEAKLQTTLTTMATTSQGYIDNMNAVGTTLSNTAQTVYNSANAAQQQALTAIRQLDAKNAEIQADLAVCHTRADEAENSAAQARQFRDETVQAASDAEIARTSTLQYMNQVAADRQVVAADKAVVATDRTEVERVAAQVAADKNVVTTARGEAQASATSANASKESAEASASTASTKATEASRSATLAQAARDNAEAAQADVTSMKLEVAADREVVAQHRAVAESAATTAKGAANTATSAKGAAETAAATATLKADAASHSAAAAQTLADAANLSALRADACRQKAEERAESAQAALERSEEIAGQMEAVTATQLSQNREIADLAEASLLQGERITREAERCRSGEQALSQKIDDVRNGLTEKIDGVHDELSASLEEAESRLDATLSDNALSSARQVADLAEASLLQGERISEERARVDGALQAMSDDETGFRLSCMKQMSSLTTASLLQTLRVNNAVTTVTMIHDSATGDTTVINEGDAIPDDIGDGDLLVVHETTPADGDGDGTVDDDF
ncbi:MAG: hypothetical protein J5861_04470 [Desulfovibrio sp.]|nr:hypothetical protein [Desulfovibrio sp.]